VWTLFAGLFVKESSAEVSCLAIALLESSTAPLKRLIGAGGNGLVRRRPPGSFKFARAFSLAAAPTKGLFRLGSVS